MWSLVRIFKVGFDWQVLFRCCDQSKLRWPCLDHFCGQFQSTSVTTGSGQLLLRVYCYHVPELIYISSSIKAETGEQTCKVMEMKFAKFLFFRQFHMFWNWNFSISNSSNSFYETKKREALTRFHWPQASDEMKEKQSKFGGWTENLIVITAFGVDILCLIQLIKQL